MQGSATSCGRCFIWGLFLDMDHLPFVPSTSLHSIHLLLCRPSHNLFSEEIDFGSSGLSHTCWCERSSVFYVESCTRGPDANPENDRPSALDANPITECCCFFNCLINTVACIRSRQLPWCCVAGTISTVAGPHCGLWAPLCCPFSSLPIALDLIVLPGMLCWRHVFPWDARQERCTSLLTLKYSLVQQHSILGSENMEKTHKELCLYHNIS